MERALAAGAALGAHCMCWLVLAHMAEAAVSRGRMDTKGEARIGPLVHLQAALPAVVGADSTDLADSYFYLTIGANRGKE